MENFKTLNQIKAEFETDPNTNKIYYRPFDYARAIALTRYIESLASDDTFALVVAHPHMTYCRAVANIDETRVFTLGLWCRYRLNGVMYYIQIDENPFFPCCMSASIPAEYSKYETVPRVKTEKTTGLADMNHIVYAGIEWENTEENITRFVKNLHAAMAECKKLTYIRRRDVPTYKNEWTEQTIYSGN